MHYIHKNKGTCSSSLQFDIEDGIIYNIKFKSGCDGNLKGIALLAEGRDAREVAQLITGVRCGSKSTSCPDQLAKAILDALRNEEEARLEAEREAENRPEAESEAAEEVKASPQPLSAAAKEVKLESLCRSSCKNEEKEPASEETDALLKKAVQ